MLTGLIIDHCHLAFHTLLVASAPSGILAYSLGDLFSLALQLIFPEDCFCIDAPILVAPAVQINALKKQGIYEKSVVILTSKHGNSPIDPSTLVRVDPAVRYFAHSGPHHSQPLPSNDCASEDGKLWSSCGIYTSQGVRCSSLD